MMYVVSKVLRCSEKDLPSLWRCLEYVSSLRGKGNWDELIELLSRRIMEIHLVG